MYFKNFFLYAFLSLTLIFASEENLPTYTLDDYVINSSPLSLNQSEMTQSWSVLENNALNDIKTNTVAETLANQPGISQSFYGPNASRPIIRGLDGFRVSVLENGLSAFDVSSTSADHTVSIDPLLVKRIEILRGSSALIYGCNAVGGVINLYDDSIPVYHSDSDFKNQFISRFSSVNDGWYNGGIIFHEMNDLIFQMYATRNTTSDYDVPSFEIHHEDEEPSLEDHEDKEVDYVNNSQSDIKTFGLGGTYHFDKGYLGISYSNYDSVYGVPNHEASILDVNKKKTTLRAFYNFDQAYFDNMHFQMTHGDYIHTEATKANEGADDEDHAASFIYKGIDSNLILRKDKDSSVSAISFNYTDYDFKIDGDESYLSGQEHHNETTGAPSESTNPRINNDHVQRFGIGLMKKQDLTENFSINGGIRYEKLSRDFDAVSRGNNPTPINIDRDDSCINASIGFAHKQTEALTIVGNLYYSERIPETSELYSSGAHHATEAFEIGDPNLKNEESIGIEMGFDLNQDKLKQNLSFYYNDFENFIYQSDTGFETLAHDDAPLGHEAETFKIREYKGSKAQIYGAEYEFDYELAASENSHSNIKGFADYINGKNKSENTYLPRISPYRIGLGYYAENGKFRFNINAVYNGESHNEAPIEEATKSYMLVNTRLAYQQSDSEIYLKINNLSNKLGFVHTSLLKETAPIPGRSFEIGYNLKF